MQSKKETADRLKAIFETATDGIITIDERGLIESMNPAALRMFGYDADELNGQNISRLMPEPHQSAHDGYIHNYKTTGERKIIGIGREVDGRRKDGSIFPFRLSISEVHLDDRRIFTGIIHDISEIKEAELQLRELNEKLEKKIDERTRKLTEVVNKLLSTNETLENEIEERQRFEDALRRSQNELRIALEHQTELNNLKTRFVTTASHEFRTPLSTILSSASLIEKYTSEEQQDRREKHIARIKSSVRNLTTILNDFLSAGKIEEGKVSIKTEEFELAPLAEEIVESMSAYLKDGQEIRLEEPPLAYMVKLDQQLLKNVCINLLSNASKYSETGQSIDFRFECSADSFSIQVKDYGMGIPEEDQKHLFERFFRASNAINIQGTGLGLNIVRSYVDMMGGRISFSSEFQKGSTFTVELKRKLSI